MLSILSQAYLKTLLLVLKAFVYTAEISQDFLGFLLQSSYLLWCMSKQYLKWWVGGGGGVLRFYKYAVE